MKLLIGTGNPAKLARYARIVRNVSAAEVVALRDVPAPLPLVEESGTTAAENARIKAITYAAATGLPTLSIDEALYLDGLPPEEQPGVYVRRYSGERATDEDLLRRYGALIRKIPPARRKAVWTYALCLARPDARAYSTAVELHEDVIDTPRLPLVPGYPLSSLLYDPALGKTHRDFTLEEWDAYLRPVSAAVRELIAEMERIIP
jgi:8-oxo-dGTP diphosphatase